MPGQIRKGAEEKLKRKDTRAQRRKEKTLSLASLHLCAFALK